MMLNFTNKKPQKRTIRYHIVFKCMELRYNSKTFKWPDPGLFILKITLTILAHMVTEEKYCRLPCNHDVIGQGIFE